MHIPLSFERKHVQSCYKQSCFFAPKRWKKFEFVSPRNVQGSIKIYKLPLPRDLDDHTIMGLDPQGGFFQVGREIAVFFVQKLV